MREVAAELEKPGPAVQRRQGLDRPAAPGREGVPARAASRSRSCTSTPGHNFPEVIAFRDRRVAELGERLVVASVQESIDRGRVVEETRAARIAQPPADDDAARRDRGARLRRGVRRRAARRGARAGQGADLLLPRRLRRLGPAPPAPRAVEPLQRAHPPRRARPRLPAQQLDRARRLAVHRRGAPRGPLDLLRPRARGLPPRRDALRGSATSSSCCAGEEPFTASVRYRTVGDMSCTGAVESTAHRAARTSSPRSPRRASPSAARPAPTTASPRRRWRTARLPATSRPATGAAPCCGRTPPPGHRRLGRRRQVDAHRPAAATTPRRSWPTSSSRSGGLAAAQRQRRRRPRAAHRRPARRARAGHHDRRRLPLLRDGAAQVRPRRHARATCSTRATWSRAPRPPTSRSCSSTRATASSSRRAATPSSPSLLGIPHVVVAVNKMDLVDYDEEIFDRIVREFTRRSPRGLRVRESTFIPHQRAARRQRRRPLRGDGLVRRGCRCSSTSRRCEIAADRNLDDVRFPVQWVIRDHGARTTAATRGSSPAASSGRATRSSCCRPGTTTTVAAIDTFDGPLDEAVPPLCVTLRLADDVDVSRGDLICRPADAPSLARELDADVCWMADAPLRPAAATRIKHATHTVARDRRRARRPRRRRTRSTARARRHELGLNDIGRVRLRTSRPARLRRLRAQPRDRLRSSSSTRPRTTRSARG